MKSCCRSVSLILLLLVVGPVTEAGELPLVSCQPQPADFKGFKIEAGKVRMTSPSWSFLLGKEQREHFEFRATATILEPAKTFRFFGESWSVWPDPTCPDGGYEAGLLLRAGEKSGYRVQLSHKYQDVALVKYPQGGYLRVAGCKVSLKEQHALAVTVQGREIVVRVDGQERIRYRDELSPLTKGRLGVGVHSGAAVTFSHLEVKDLPGVDQPAQEKHQPSYSMRKWLGGRQWIFDGDEPILLLPTPRATSINNVKLRPGYRPQLSWNGQWDIANQGAFKEGENRLSEPTVTGGGKTISASWSSRQVKDRFVTRSRMTVGYDDRRATYTYDIESQLEVLPGEPFHFRYGYDFEHHTPLDPFRWQYLLLRRSNGELVHRPVYPVDPGPQNDLASYQGQRIWYGRHRDPMPVCPAVEYQIDPYSNVDPDKPGQLRKRRLNTAVCAAFYDTGVSFEPETAKPGTKVNVRYRYTGYPASEAEVLFKSSRVYDSLMLDPKHHYIFADDWPRLRFNQFVPLSETWIYGRTPFMSGHNTRPTYELARETGVGSGFAMKLGPGAVGTAPVKMRQPLAAGRYVLIGQCKSINAHGPGGRLELLATQARTGKELARAVHHVGNGSFDWKTVGLVLAVPREAAGLKVTFGNAGTGEVLFAEVDFRKLEEGQPVPEGVAARPAAEPPPQPAVPAGALADYRMEEGSGLHVLNRARGPFGMLELANLDWVVDSGRPALRFADRPMGKPAYPRAGVLDRGYFSHPSYKDKTGLPVAVAGTHGGGFELKAFTLAAWIKPAAEMGKAQQRGTGDIAGLGARRVILRLEGHKAPYRLAAALNVNDRFSSNTRIESDRWCHVTLTGEPTEGRKWRVRLFLDGKQVQEGTTQKLESPLMIPPSLILGAELFYMHTADYRGLIGRTTVYNRTLTGEEVAALANEKASGK